MDRAVNEQIQLVGGIDSILGALRGGWILLDSNGNIASMDHGIRERMDGELQQLQHLQLSPQREESSIDCSIMAMQIELDGEQQDVCVIQANNGRQSDRELQRLIVAIEGVMSEPQWFTQALIEKLKAWRQAAQPSARISDLDVLTAREREILALICEGRTDVEMGRMLELSQNTVRNHVASLFRKLGVNRRSAAVIWARERGITKHDVRAYRKTRHRQD